MLYLTDDEFQMISNYIKENYGVNLSKKKSLIESRLSNHVTALGYSSYKEYFHYAMADKSTNEITVLINKLTTNHTYFMREKEHFTFFADTILPWVDRTLRTRDLRVWSAGCSTGQEPYTLSMIALNYLGANSEGWDSTILASDISNKVLLKAKEGIYKREELEGLPENWIRRYFHRLGENRYVVSNTLKNNVVYRNINLLSAFQFKKPFQAILCRNVMIYFDTPVKNEIIRKFYDVLLPGGYLFVGLSESLSGCNHRFKSIKPSVYRKVD